MAATERWRALLVTLALGSAACGRATPPLLPFANAGTRVVALGPPKGGDARDRSTAPDAEVVAPTRVSLALQQDFGLLHGGADCSRTSQLDDEVPCFRRNGTQYHGTPAPGSEVTSGGLQPATTRILAGVERVVLERWALGVRAGVALRGGPTPEGSDAPAFLPLHVEGRVTYWIADAPFAAPGFRLGLFGGAGIAQVDTRGDVGVQEAGAVPPPATQLDNPPSQTLAAWHKAGTAFVGGGVALACAFRASSAFVVELRGMQHFPSSGTTVSQSIGFEQGF